MTGPADILVAGAGPAGLELAWQAHDHGAVVDTSGKLAQERVG